MRDPKKKSTKPGPGRPTKRRKPTISIIGAGRLGTTLGRALSEHGYKVEVVAAQHRASARRAAKSMGLNVKALAVSDLKSVPDSELVLITTPDNVIGPVARQLSRSNPNGKSSRAGVRRRVVLHASGALSSEELAPLRNLGFAVGSLHPLVSISNRASDINVFRNAFFCLEGDSGAVSMARSIVRALGGQSFYLSHDNKPLYHAAAVMASGHVTALVDIATEMLIKCGLSQPRARAVLMPLLESTVANLVAQTPARALTGTFARGEADTARRHLDAISAGKLNDALAAYTILGKRSLQLAAENGMDRKALSEIRKEVGAALRFIRRRS